ncbi:superoxide dismutase family protein [Deinococcus arenicola]|uniref:Superoxide dismutase family protein n=1 Tax=Deinococcus arenicola TaxID=2994950 RepID=A0ABU4DU50_9DEIO|nr:superoxide dismutase family protein [Deinococcus sp. ZS9-10]MDV6375502.1 superoxide dismutase family protein [Deinococcus sp. ZS9-10]
MNTARMNTAQKTLVFGLGSAALLLSGLVLAGGTEPMTGMMPANLKATAAMRDAAGEVRGAASFEQVGMGMRVTVTVSGLTPGMHGMHLHEFGRCTPGVDPAENKVVPFGGAGGHFDPGGSANHDSPTAGNKYGHGGDLPMLNVGADGVGKATFTTSKDSLTGKNGVLNRSLVVHADMDDYKSDPSGKSGARERCGVILRDNFTVRDYPLPGPQDFPEGVAYDARKGVIYTGSAANGNIYAVNANTGATILFSKGGAVGRSTALGLKVDSLGRVWVAGGATGAVSILSPDGAPVATLMTPPSPNPYLNDLTPTPDGSVYVTDSTRPVIWRVRDMPNPSKMTVEPWLDLGGTPINYGPGINLNGIVASPDGRYLLTVQLNTGELWRIDTGIKAIKKVMGGLTNGDGLLLDGQTLYVSRNADGMISKVNLSADYGSGTLVREEPLAGLRFPTTLVKVGSDVVVAQGQLDKLKGGIPETPFKLTRFKTF